MQAAPQRTVFYGGVIVVASMLIIALGVGMMFSLGVFMEPLQRAFGWGRGQIAQASLYGWLAFGVGSLGFGAFSDRYGTRRAVMLGGLLFGCGMFALSRIQEIWHLSVVYGVCVGGGAGAFMVPLLSTVTRWFNRRRALMVALTNCGTGIGAMCFAPLTRSLIMAYDWRSTFIIYGVLTWIVVLPLALLIRNHPRDMGLEPLGGDAETHTEHAPADTTFGTVLTKPAFWVIAGVHFLCCAAHSGPIFHMVSAAIDAGVAKLAAATVFASSGFASVFGRIGSGVLADRLGSKNIMVAWLFMQSAAIILYLFPRDFGDYAGLAVYFGLTYGGVMPLYAVVIRDFFGEQAMGRSYGTVFFLSCIGMGLGPWLGGWLFDMAGTYTTMYVLSAMFGGAGALLALGLHRPTAARASLRTEGALG